METLKKIITLRKDNKWPSWDLVYEWEDIIRSEFSLSFYYESAINRYAKKIPHPFLSQFLYPSDPAFMFQMGPDLRGDYNKSNIIPCIIDFFLRKEDLPLFYRRNSQHPVLLVSSKEAVDYFRQNDCSLSIYHFPLSLPDKYRFTRDCLSSKKYDVVLVGRTNTVLMDYLQRYAKAHPDFYYVYRELAGNSFNYYTSRGEFLGDICSRDQYISLLRKSRIGLYATPGMDDGSSRTNGFNPVTPRFLEMISCGCHVLARYPDNAETDFYEFRSFGPSIESYRQFEDRMDKALFEEVDEVFYEEYLSKHYTSKRCELLKQILKDINHE